MRLRGPGRASFEIKGRWENGGPHPQLNYDFWYQPRQNVLASSEFGEPAAYEPGFDLEDVAAGRYGSRLHFWNLAERRVEQTVELGEAGLVRSRSAGCTIPTPTRASSAPPSRARCGTSTARTAATAPTR